MYCTKFLSLLIFVGVGLKYAECVAPAQMPAPTISLIKSTSFTVNFESVSSAARYHVTVVPRYDTTSTRSFTLETTSYVVENRSESTLYDVSVRAENADGEIGTDSPTAAVQTMPGAPTLKADNPLPTGTFVFFNTRNSARVSKWRLEYKEKASSATANVTDSGYYALWLSGLKGNTEYEIRGRALQLIGTIDLTDSDVDFSAWQTIKTDTLSIYGRVVMANLVYNNSYSNQTSNEWGSTLATIQDAYSSVTTALTVSLIRIEDNSGKPRVYYQLRVTDQTLPSGTDYTISGSQFSDSIVNNGDEAIGTPYIFIAPLAYTLTYDPDTTKACSKLVDRYMLVTPENQNTFEAHLNVVAAEAASADESDALEFNGTELILDNGKKIEQSVSLNTVIGLNPKFFVQDCLKNQPPSENNPLYSQLLWALDALQPTNRIEGTFFTTALDSSIFNISGITSISGLTSTIVQIPAVDKAIKYEILIGSSVILEISEENIDGSEYISVPVTWSPQLQISVTFSVRVTTRTQNGGTNMAASNNLTISSDRNTCAICSSNAFCISMSSQVLSCICNYGYVGDGRTCTIPSTILPQSNVPGLATTSGGTGRNPTDFATYLILSTITYITCRCIEIW